MPKTQPQTKVTPTSPGNPPGQSMISNLILYPRGAVGEGLSATEVLSNPFGWCAR